MITAQEITLIARFGVEYGSKQWCVYWVDVFFDIARAIALRSRYENMKGILE